MTRITHWTRRHFLGALCAGGALALGGGRARAIGPGSKLRIGHVQLPDGNWNPRPSALRRLAWEIDKRTSIDVDLDAKFVKLGDADLSATPFLYLSGDREFAVPPTAEIERLRRFLTFGGFLLIDSAEGRTDGAFDTSVRQLVAALFPPPAAGLAMIPREHVVYKSFYLIDHPQGRLALSPTMDAVTGDGRLMLVYNQNDLGGAYARDNLGNYEHECRPGGERQRELAFRLGVNLVMYALCLDYKTDQVHVPFIMRRRRWRADEGAPR